MDYVFVGAGGLQARAAHASAPGPGGAATASTGLATGSGGATPDTCQRATAAHEASSGGRLLCLHQGAVAAPRGFAELMASTTTWVAVLSTGAMVLMVAEALLQQLELQVAMLHVLPAFAGAPSAVMVLTATRAVLLLKGAMTL